LPKGIKDLVSFFTARC